MSERLDTRVAGFTLVEMIIGITILGVLAKLLVGATSTVGGFTETGTLRAQLLDHGDRALSRIVEDLRMSGFQEVDGLDFPYVFDNGVASGGFAHHSYTPANQTAAPGDSDYGVHTSIVLCLPTDLDGDGRPEMDVDGNGVPELDLDGDGVPTDEAADVGSLWPFDVDAEIHADTRLVWSHEPVSYVVTADTEGQPELLRVVDAGATSQEVVSRYVERLVFETPESSGGAVPTGSVRVTLYMRAFDAAGRLVRDVRQAVVRLRNS